MRRTLPGSSSGNNMPLIFHKWITRQDLRSNPNVLYCFGDNTERWGLGGQAKEMRGEPNAVGIATLKSPGEFWDEDNVAQQCAVLDKDWYPVFEALQSGRTVIFPLDGIGTGLADLERRSPTTFAYLKSGIERMKRYAP